MRPLRRRVTIAVVAVPLGFAACGGADATTDTTGPDADVTAPTAVDDTSEQRYPDVIDAAARQDGDTWTFDVTISSPYDTPERYADGWRVVGPDGTEFGFRLLTHDHAAEQPFTRSLDEVSIPDDVDVVTVEGRDLEHGFGGQTFELQLPR